MGCWPSSLASKTRADAVRTFYRMIASTEPTTRDLLSQEALGLPPPRSDPEFLEVWRGLSVFDTYEAVRAQAVRLRPRWKHGEYIAVLEVPEEAPFAMREYGHKGHWLLYEADGGVILEAGAGLLCSYFVEAVHGPSVSVFSRGR